ncbi:MAG TPA: Lrp/AsnC family transcriptional regulator [Streptosporangiaceae bacterium]|nr:Lrp/AsnC family transcriptional regulator [Streptosporangiaceae bacterium]
MVSKSDGSDLHPALDDVDRAIVQALRRDGRMSMRALAQELHISRAATYTRVQRLEGAGVITGYTATIDPERYGHGVSAYVYLKIAQRTWKPLRDRLMQMGQVEHAALVSGGGTDIVLLVRARDVRALRDLVLERLHTMPEVISTETVMIFDEAVRVPQSSRAG